MFDAYRNRIDLLGGNIRDSLKRQSVEISESLFSNSTSVRKVIVRGEKMEAKITTDSKTTVRGGNGNYVIEFHNGFVPKAGTYVEVFNERREKYEPWLILYESEDITFPKHIIKRCNYLLRWKNSVGRIIERWAVFGDNSRIQDGEYNVSYGKMFMPRVMTSLILPCDRETVNIRLDQRFMIDYKGVNENPDVYKVTNRNVISKTFNELEGVIELAVVQHQYNQLTDSREEMIADYHVEIKTDKPAKPADDLTCKISFNGTSDLKMGTPFKKYSAEFYRSGIRVNDIIPVWEIILSETNKNNITHEVEDDKFKIKCKYNPSLIGSHIRLIAKSKDGTAVAELPIKVVSSI